MEVGRKEGEDPSEDEVAFSEVGLLMRRVGEGIQREP